MKVTFLSCWKAGMDFSPYACGGKWCMLPPSHLEEIDLHFLFPLSIDWCGPLSENQDSVLAMDWRQQNKKPEGMKGLFVPLGLDSWPGYHRLRIPGEWGINSCLVAAPNVPFFYSLACILTTCHWIWKLLHNSSVMLLRQLSVGVWKLTWDRFEARMVEISHSQLILFWKTEPENCGWAKKEKKKGKSWSLRLDSGGKRGASGPSYLHPTGAGNPFKEQGAPPKSMGGVRIAQRQKPVTFLTFQEHC